LTDSDIAGLLVPNTASVPQCHPLCNALLLPVALAPPPSKFRDVDSRPAHEQPIPILQQQRRHSEPFSRAVPTQALHKVHS
jgi:hypothetical protein